MSGCHMQVDVGLGKEYGRFDFPAAAPNLALLGGMGRACDTELFEFILYQLGRFERVFYVLGKDEFHGSDSHTTIRAMNKFTKELESSGTVSNSDGTPTRKLGGFHFLHRARVDLEDITILGCTLWRDSTSDRGGMRENACRSFRPIKEFYAEEEQAERELDIAWLESELNACANGEGPVLNSPDGDAGHNPAPAPEEYMEEDEGDIYDDVPMSPPPQPADLPAESGDTLMLGVDSAEQPGSDVEVAAAASKPRQGPARRVLVLTYFPPTYNETTHPKWKPTDRKTDDVESLLKDRQCWAIPGGVGNGVSVHSPLHGNGTPHPTKPSGSDSVAQTNPSERSNENTESCSHNESVHPESDSLRPPGLAAWAFGHSGWSCDIQYDVNKPKPEPEPSYYGRKKTTPPPPHDLPCPSCKRVPALVRMVSNQRGQQWERNRQPYVDVPATWRAFDDAFVIDV
ncbi:hypothetical protein FRC10_000140 [Ceratobasidium sp. 414]|nr:hypothetical protein FRC10_000140 [Ceratobasidium sp. 414]